MGHVDCVHDDETAVEEGPGGDSDTLPVPGNSGSCLHSHNRIACRVNLNKTLVALEGGG